MGVGSISIIVDTKGPLDNEVLRVICDDNHRIFGSRTFNINLPEHVDTRLQAKIQLDKSRRAKKSEADMNIHVCICCHYSTSKRLGNIIPKW